MKTTLAILFLTLTISLSMSSQDTIYSPTYQNGIITKSIEKKKSLASGRIFYIFRPINNEKLEVKIMEKNVSKIKYSSGEIFINPKYIADEDEIIIMPTDPLTAKINYTNVIEAKDAKCKSLFNAFKGLPQSEIKYNLIASDETDFSFQRYVGRVAMKYAGDPYILYFNLMIKFKDGKIKYEYSDFVAVFEKLKSNQNLFSIGVNTTTIASEHILLIDQLYTVHDKSNIKMFWRPLIANINESIASLKKICLDTSGPAKDW